MTKSDRTAGPENGWPADRPLFRAGELVGARYRVERFVGEGGMGEVYAVEDLELGTEVALKVLRMGARVQRSAAERFKREIRLARRVSHRNVCRIFDLGVHQREGSAPLLFLTMELVAGTTLVDHLERHGPLSEEETVAIASQLATALDAAHRAGVVHRDFKSSNILLSEDGEGRRVVVTDFGLAREMLADPQGRTLTTTGGIFGTPAYMAPEQVEGKPADQRSDLYSFGVVLYEMLTGAFPFDGESPLSVAVKRLHEPPRPAESHRGDLSQRARAVLSRCLQRDPEERFADASAIVDALAGGEMSRSPRQRLRWRVVVGAVAAIVLVAGAVSVLRHPWAETPRTQVMEVPRRPAVAVLPLRNASRRTEGAWLSTALAEMLATELAAGDSLRTISGETVARVTHDLELAPAEAPAGEALRALRDGLGADILVTGSYVTLGGSDAMQLRLDLRLQHADGSDPQSRAVEGSEQQLFDVVARAGAELRSALGVAATPGNGGVRATLPESERAVRFYVEGLDRLRAGAPLEARALFEQSLAEDARAPRVWSALSSCWSRLGYDERALEAAREAFERRETLPRVDALRIEGRYRLVSQQWDAAIEIERALWRLFGDDLEQGLTLAEAFLAAERGREVLDLVPALRALPEPAGRDPRIDLVEARAADGLSDFRRQLDAGRRADARAREIGSRVLAAQALYEQGLAQRKLGDPKASRDALEESRRLAAAAGDRNGAAAAVLSLANLVRAAGDLDAAAGFYADARATFAAIGSRQREARAEFLQGLVTSQQGDVAGAIDLYESALAKMRQIDDRRGAAVALSNIGTLLAERGDLAGALARHQEAMAEFRQLGDQSRLVVSLQNVALIRQQRGDLAGAQHDLDEELELARSIEDRLGEGYALKALGDLAFERDDLDAAEARYGEAERAFEASGHQDWLLSTRQARALVARERGEAGESARRLAEVAAAFERSGMNEDRDEAEVERVRSLVAAGELVAAERAAAGVLERAKASEVRRVRRLALLASARLAEARGDAAGARRLLENELESSRESGLVLDALEARIELARLDFVGGSADAASRLAGAEAEALRLGAGRLARAARRVRSVS